MNNGNVIFMKEIAVWICPDCGFTFDACHTDEKDGGYSCPACAEIRLEKMNADMKKVLEWYGDEENYRRSDDEYQQGYPQEIMWDKGRKARDVIASLQGTESRRDSLLKRLSRFSAVHQPDIASKTDDELELFVKMLESMFKEAFE